MQHRPVNDPQLMWQRQTREHPALTINDLRTRAQSVQRKVRLNLTIAFALGSFLLILCATFISNSTSYSLARLVASAIMALTVVIAYQAYRRMWAPNILWPDAAMKGCLAFYRRELESQHRSIALTWRFIGPVVVFMFLTWNVMLRTPSLLPRVLLPSILVLILFLRRREVRRFKHKLALLDEFEKER